MQVFTVPHVFPTSLNPMQKYKGGAFGGTTVRALASHQGSLGLSPYFKAIRVLNKG